MEIVWHLLYILHCHLVYLPTSMSFGIFCHLLVYFVFFGYSLVCFGIFVISILRQEKSGNPERQNTENAGSVFRNKIVCGNVALSVDFNKGSFGVSFILSQTLDTKSNERLSTNYHKQTE
jgi:hypothetical protein